MCFNLYKLCYVVNNSSIKVCEHFRQTWNSLPIFLFNSRFFLSQMKPKHISDCLSFTHSEGSNLTPAHHHGDFRFKTYAPIAFRYFRELFGIRPDDYLVSWTTHRFTQFPCTLSNVSETRGSLYTSMRGAK